MKIECPKIGPGVLFMSRLVGTLKGVLLFSQGGEGVLSLGHELTVAPTVTGPCAYTTQQPAVGHPGVGHDLGP